MNYTGRTPRSWDEDAIADDEPRKAWKIQVRVAGDEAWRDHVVSIDERGNLCRAFYGTREQALMLAPNAGENGIAEVRVIDCVPPRLVAEGSCLMVWDESHVFKADDAKGCATPETADTGGAMLGCLGWAMIVFIAAMLWIIYAGVTG